MAKLTTKRKGTKLSNSGSTTSFEEEACPSNGVTQRSLRGRVIKTTTAIKKQKSNKKVKGSKKEAQIEQEIEIKRDRTFSLSPVVVKTPLPIASSTFVGKKKNLKNKFKESGLRVEIKNKKSPICEINKKCPIGVTFGNIQEIDVDSANYTFTKEETIKIETNLTTNGIKKSSADAQNHTPIQNGSRIRLNASIKSTAKTSFVKTPFKTAVKSTPRDPKGTDQKSASKSFTRTKLPNFAEMHKRNFDQMESLYEHAKRKADRARVLMNTPSTLGTSNRTNNGTSKPAYNRFGFKNLQTDIKKTYSVQEITKERPVINERQQKYLQMSKKTHDKTENTTSKRREVLKGVRLNKRFELQMKFRDCN